MATNQVKQWHGDRQTECDVCGRTLSETFIDGKTQRGLWAIMCPECHERVGVGLGVGKGQRFEVPKLGRPMTAAEFAKTL